MYFLKLLVFTFLIGTGLFKSSQTESVQWVISSGCSLKVQGSTNINQFTCVIVNIGKPDTLTVVRGRDDGLAKMSGMLKLDLKAFDCFNPMMTADLRKTLKVKEFPHMTIRFINISSYPHPVLNHSKMHGLVTIEMAGVSRKYDVAYTITSNGKDRLTLKGIRQINFSDFNIVPPRKIGGMIQTNDKLTAEFNLVLKVLK